MLQPEIILTIYVQTANTERKKKHSTTEHTNRKTRQQRNIQMKLENTIQVKQFR